MLRLNLLSKEAKKEVKFKRLYALVIRVDFLLLLSAVFLVIIFTGSKILLQNTFKEFANQDSLLKISSQDYNEKIRQINDQIKTVSKIQNEFIYSSLLVKELTDRIPDGIYLSYIKADISQRVLRIIGRAQTRENFLALKQKLENSTVFIEVDSPLQNILQKENIDFEMSIKLDLSELNAENK
jgi:Tfp pilus assembly protein PilN